MLSGYSYVILPGTHGLTEVHDLVLRNASGHSVVVDWRLVGNTVTINSNINMAGSSLLITGI